MPPTTSTTMGAQSRRQGSSSKAGGSSRSAAPPSSSSSSTPRKADSALDDDFVATDSDSDEEEEEAALQMDGQDLWNQNFCSVCDCLIPPGTGVGALNTHSASASASKAPISPVTATVPMSKTSSASSGLRSTTGTIKGRPTSSDGPKRASSATKLDSAANRRQGSSSNRLNALSDLKPTTRLNGDQNNQAKTSPKVSRRSSNTSVKSTSTTSSGPLEPESPSVASSTTTLPRSRKGGLLGGLTPAALRQQEQQASQAKAPPALYCSERCRAIDEHASPTGLAELSLYSSQPPNAAAMSSWASSNSTWSPDAPFTRRAWPRTASTTSIPLAYSNGTNGLGYSVPATQTPDSEYAPCMCPECLDKLSASGTVPSGASDTAESSSSGHMHGSRPGGGSSNGGYYNGGYYRTQRSRSGRIVTPQNLYPPHHYGNGGEDGYFPSTSNYSAPVALEAPTSSSSRRNQSISSSTGVPDRTASAASARSGTDSSTQSMDSAASMWEPALKPRRRSQPQHAPFAGARSIQRGLDALPPSLIASERSSRHFEGDDPAASQITVSNRSSDQEARSTDTVAVPASQQRSRTSTSTPDGVPYSAASSSLRLLRGNTHRASPSVDVSGEAAYSPSVSLRGPLSTSITSEHTLGTSAQTLVHREPSLRERRYGKGKSLLMNLSDSQSSNDVSRCSSRAQAGRPSEDHVEHQRRSPGPSSSSRVDLNSAQGLSMSYAGSGSGKTSDALQALRAASRRASQISDKNDPQEGSRDASRRYSLGNGLLPGASSGWLKSLSSALTSLRVPSSATPPTIVVPNDDPSPDGRNRSPARASSAVSQGQSMSSASPGGRSAVTATSDNMSSSNLSRSAASESLSRMLAQAGADSSEGKASPSSGLARPGASRGSVPAFAKEIGNGQIPGEADVPAQRGRSGTTDGASSSSRDRSSTLSSSAGGSQALSDQVAEEKRRRRAEHRHQRSRDVTVLPPLLAPSNRSGTALSAQNRASSYVNLAQQRNRSRSRSSIGAGGPAFTIGSYGSSYTPSRPITPGLASPSVRGNRSGESDASTASSNPALHRVGSQQDVSVNSRRATLGWSGSGMTPITPSLVETAHPRSIGNGHAAHASHYLQQHQGTHHHHHHQPSHRPTRHVHHPSASHAHGPPTTLTTRGGHALGHLGLLGHHPHGSQPVYGRHNTMPVRTSTPIVPEDGGEMSGAALTGIDDGQSQQYHTGYAVDRPRSAVGHRRNSQLSMHQHHHHHHQSSLQPPSRPGSSMALRPIAASPHHQHYHHHHHQSAQAPPRWSYDNLANAERDASSGAGVRTYPLLQLPGREETHDRYDDAWSNAVELIAGPEGVKMAAEERARRMSLRTSTSSSSVHGGEGASAARGANQDGGGGEGGWPGPAKRKQLFHFG